MQKRLTLLLALVILCGLLLAPLAAYAQEETTTVEAPAAEAVAASGLPVLILLIGVGAVVVVGGYMMIQTRSRENSE